MKILKNNTNSVMFLKNLGITIQPLDQVSINVFDYALLASDDVISELTPIINSGDLIINNGNEDLSGSFSISYLKYPDNTANQMFNPSGSVLLSTNAESAIKETASIANNAIILPRYTIPLVYNGTVSNNEFIGYLNLIPGDTTPIVVPVNSIMKEYTFSNRKSVDFSLQFISGSTSNAPFITTTKTNTQYFVESGLNEQLNQGDIIYIKYIANGTRAHDITILLVLQAI